MADGRWQMSDNFNGEGRFDSNRLVAADFTIHESRVTSHEWRSVFAEWASPLLMRREWDNADP